MLQTVVLSAVARVYFTRQSWQLHLWNEKRRVRRLGNNEQRFYFMKILEGFRLIYDFLMDARNARDSNMRIIVFRLFKKELHESRVLATNFLDQLHSDSRNVQT